MCLLKVNKMKFHLKILVVDLKSGLKVVRKKKKKKRNLVKIKRKRKHRKNNKSTR